VGNYTWIDSDGTEDYGSMLFIDNKMVASVDERDGYYYGYCYMLDDFNVDVLGVHNLNFAKNEMLNKKRSITINVTTEEIKHMIISKNG
jgi:hypothetical protein